MLMGFPGRDYATPTELAERLQMTHNSCVGLIARTEQQGLVYKTTNPHDGRSVYVKLTEKGLLMLESLSEIHVNELDHIGFDILLNGKGEPH
jgi:DNA-binding MarR family transcriptional regulator